jgi:hypothetical protein
MASGAADAIGFAGLGQALTLINVQSYVRR